MLFGLVWFGLVWFGLVGAYERDSSPDCRGAHQSHQEGYQGPHTLAVPWVGIEDKLAVPFRG